MSKGGYTVRKSRPNGQKDLIKLDKRNKHRMKSIASDLCEKPGLQVGRVTLSACKNLFSNK